MNEAPQERERGLLEVPKIFFKILLVIAKQGSPPGSGTDSIESGKRLVKVRIS